MADEAVVLSRKAGLLPTKVIELGADRPAFRRRDPLQLWVMNITGSTSTNAGLLDRSYCKIRRLMFVGSLVDVATIREKMNA